MDPIGRTSRRHFIVSAWIMSAGGCAWAPVRSGLAVRRDDPDREPAKPISPEELEELRAQLVAAHNRIRTEAKLKRLTINRKLTAAAQRMPTTWPPVGR